MQTSMLDDAGYYYFLDKNVSTVLKQSLVLLIGKKGDWG